MGRGLIDAGGFVVEVASVYGLQIWEFPLFSAAAQIPAVPRSAAGPPHVYTVEQNAFNAPLWVHHKLVGGFGQIL